MMPCSLIVLLAALAMADGEGFVPKCTGLLGGVVASGHTDLEVAAFCRQAYTPDMCSTMRGSLGPMPWPEAKIQMACQQWGGDLEGSSERDLLTYREFNEALDTSAKKKRELGYRMPRKFDGTVDLDRAVRKKFVETQIIVRSYNAYYGGGDSKKGSDEQRKWTAGRLAFPEGLDGGPQLAACGLALVALVASVGLPLVRMARRSQQPQPEEGVLLESLDAADVE